jgi:hypothetical protein
MTLRPPLQVTCMALVLGIMLCGCYRARQYPMLTAPLTVESRIPMRIMVSTPGGRVVAAPCQPFRAVAVLRQWRGDTLFFSQITVPASARDPVCRIDGAGFIKLGANPMITVQTARFEPGRTAYAGAFFVGGTLSTWLFVLIVRGLRDAK